LPNAGFGNPNRHFGKPNSRFGKPAFSFGFNRNPCSSFSKNLVRLQPKTLFGFAEIRTPSARLLNALALLLAEGGT
jgi:hypothetical protein